MAKLLKNRTDNDIKNKWNAMNRSQQRKQARFSPQISSLSTDTESLDSFWPSFSPKQLVKDEQASNEDNALDEKNMTEV